MTMINEGEGVAHFKIPGNNTKVKLMGALEYWRNIDKP